MKNLSILAALVIIGMVSGLLPLLLNPMMAVLLPIFGVAAFAASISAIARMYKQQRRDRAIADQEIAF